MSKATDTNFEILYKTALGVADFAAQQAVISEPMVLTDGTATYVVADGPCGFGWVTFKATSAFGRWAKKAGVARSAYPTGLQVWSKAVTQSLARNEAWAEAFATVLRQGGIDARAHSRID